jgi:hypothetical protein
LNESNDLSGEFTDDFLPAQADVKRNKLVFTTSKHGRYFQGIGRPAAFWDRIRPPTPEEIQHFVKTAALYDYWLATPAENTSVGIRVLQFTHR